jgi:hypothetical protein
MIYVVSFIFYTKIMDKMMPIKIFCMKTLLESCMTKIIYKINFDECKHWSHGNMLLQRNKWWCKLSDVDSGLSSYNIYQTYPSGNGCSTAASNGRINGCKILDVIISWKYTI